MSANCTNWMRDRGQLGWFVSLFRMSGRLWPVSCIIAMAPGLGAVVTVAMVCGEFTYWLSWLVNDGNAGSSGRPVGKERARIAIAIAAGIMLYENCWVVITVTRLLKAVPSQPAQKMMFPVE